MLELIAADELSEGHGRAILQARGAETRASLAREAGRSRLVGTRDRAPGQGGRRHARVQRSSPIPDQEAALVRAEEALEEALGTGVRVRSDRRGIRAELHFDDLDDLLAFARSRHVASEMHVE